MKMPPRGGRQPYANVHLIRPFDSARVVLGESSPQEDDRRARATAQWGAGHTPPRRQPQAATIDTPLPPRVQTLLAYDLDPATRARLNAGHGPAPMSRRESEQTDLGPVSFDHGDRAFDD